ncbi:signal transduction histidine kinase internal region [Lucifera butyrica]|uniref:histidine kinase n=2 Tax=Lucifera butyrica TaxID=1351585 RepID=A0A498R3J9_9FIRM|nr:signal transduction histidine kinase internal region [Lucifera butyrica]
MIWRKVREAANFRRYSLRVKLLIMFVILSILPIALIQTISYNLSRYYLEKKINMLTDINLFHIETSIESNISSYEETAYRIAVDNSVIHDMEMFNTGNDFEKAASISKIRDDFVSYALARDEIRAITFVNEELKSAFYDKRNNSAYNSLWDCFDIAEKRKIYSKIMESNSIVILPTSSIFTPAGKEFAFHIGLRVRNLKTREELGIIILSVDERHLESICNIEQSQTGSNNKVNIYSFVIDNNGKIISFQDERYIGTYIQEYMYQGSRYAKINPLGFIIRQIPQLVGKNVIINDTPIKGTDWRVITIVDKDSMFYEVNILRDVTLAISILVILISVTLIILFTNRFHESVQCIVNGMKAAKKGDFGVRIMLATQDELAFIGNEFNEMVARINKLVIDIKQKSVYIYEISNKRREAELKALVAQVNPHFLYNTLDCINWMALRKEEYEISNMLSNLAQILRYSIGNVNKQVEINNEIEWLKKYIYLQQVRFNNSFVLTLDIDEALLECKIYKLLLQPLVENAIIHGFKGFDSGRELYIGMERQPENKLRITVGDNGAGIPQDKLEQILKQELEDNIGISNVWNRLKIYYGEEAGLDVMSEEGKGTRVILTIPLVN